ncbi:MAG: hypothetical protein ONB46_20870 [candidate division KSB1 bacterium]|nr:hypothetical protein [candidate division KSB1 bacterium]MDZ7368396.1 hypothetical protein [candidate division KSB1 bacterium]MDZ7406028.1 hypothetical protein [candidate division KSB1 bacterium]
MRKTYAKMEWLGMAMIHIIRAPVTPEQIAEMRQVFDFFYKMKMQPMIGAPKSTPPASGGRIVFSNFSAC